MLFYLFLWSHIIEILNCWLSLLFVGFTRSEEEAMGKNIKYICTLDCCTPTVLSKSCKKKKITLETPPCIVEYNLTAPQLPKSP